MQIKWDPKIGPAAIVGIVGSLSILVSIGIAWGTTTSRIEAAALKAEQAKLAADKTNQASEHRDQKIAAQAERLGRIETAIQFIVPTLQRIEQKLDVRK